MSALDDNGIPSGESRLRLEVPGPVINTGLTMLVLKTKVNYIYPCLLIAVGVKGKVQGNLFKIITQSDTRYFIQAPTRQEKTEWIEAIKQQT